MDWMKFYYAHPDPDRLVDEVHALDQARRLDLVERRIMVATFLGRVFAANPGRIEGWLDTLAERLVTEGGRNTLQIAAYFSNTPEGRAWLVKIGGDPAQMQDSRDLLTAPVREGVMLDALWAHYFATGDAHAVRRVVTALEHLPDAGAAERYESTEKTEADLERAMNDTMFQAASWSLASLAREHKPLLELCEWMLDGPDLTPNQRLGLGLVLERAAPERWSVDINPDANQARIHKRDKPAD